MRDEGENREQPNDAVGELTQPNLNHVADNRLRNAGQEKMQYMQRCDCRSTVTTGRENVTAITVPSEREGLV